LPSFEDAPHSPTEEVLLGIWRDVLGVTPASVYDNFFDLGGHSLLATRAIARVREAFGLEVPLRDLFEAPTLARFAQRIETRRASSLGAEATQVPPLQPVERTAALPLSFAQERLWFLHQLAPDSPAYTILTAVRLHGPLDTGALEWCLQAIIQRHEVLRTTFPAADGQPLQHIAPPESAASYHLALVRLEQTDDTATLEAALQQHAHQEVLRPYDLAHGPLLRATLLHLDERGEAHMLLLSMHHIISDAWSLELLVDELRTLYRERTTEALPTLPVQYADFACWQRAWLHGLVLEQQLAYWRTQLANLPPLLDLPTDYPRTASAAATAGYQPFTIAPPLAQALAALSKQAQATLFMTLLAAFQVVLARYSNQSDIPVGTPVANRTHHDLEHLIGLFVNTLVLRSDLADNPSFLDLLQRVRKTALEAYARQDVPFEMVVEALQPTRDLRHTPLFQVMVTLDRAAHAPGHPTTTDGVDGLTIAPYRMLPTGVAKFDLALMLWEYAPEQALTGVIEYRADLFAATTIAHMADHFQVLLTAIVADPRQPVLSLPLLTNQERQQTLDEWNATAADYPRQVCIHTMLEAQVEQTPDGVALVWEDTYLTYGELNHRANQLAHYLRSHGIGPDVVVGLCIERSFDFVVAALAILKAGGAYLPMDPEYPPARLTFMLEDAQTPVVLTHQTGQDLRLAPQQPAPDTPGSDDSPLIINLAAEMTRATLTQQPTHNPDTSATGVTADHLAYVIYTSGSTGTPKGVEITHRSLVNLVCWHHRTFPLSPQDRATQVAGLGFDAAVWEVWPYLTAGAAIFFPDEETRLSPSRLRDWLVDQDITITLLTTPIAEQVLTLDWPQQCALRYLLTGGDTLRRYPTPELPFTLVNNYGPTEYTVVTTSTVVAPRPADSAATPAHPPIGRPIANTRIYVLDEQMHPLPPGIPGELYIGGDGLARGYRNRPELTAQKFVADPFSTTPGARLYRTGDRVRSLPDGNIAFLGRVDAQVKLRGLRIEPGEIETALTQHPFVQAAAVVAHEDAQGEKRLVAYIVLSAAAPRETPDARHRMSELRRSLQTTLPTAMIPSAMLVLDALPLTRHGKIDRHALPVPDFAPGAEPVFASTVAYVAPRNHREETLADIWAVALGIDHVGVYDNFFELGGHSLMAARIVARIREVFQVDLPMRALFAAPTITDLAPLVAQQEHERYAAAAPPPPPLSTKLATLFTPQPDQQYQPFPLTDVQQAYWIGRSAAFALGNVAAHAYFEIESHTLEPYRFGEVWDRLILRHPMLRTIVLPDGQQQTLETVPPYYIEVQDLRGHDHQAVRAALAALRQHLSHQVFVPDQWPLFDVRITRLDDRRVRLHLSIDGLILDGWSLVLLSQEIARLYDDLDTPLPQLAITFRDYVLAETALQQTALYQRSLDYWLQRLETLPPAPALPLRQEPAAITHPRFTRHSQRLDRATWARLKVRASRAGLTPSGILVSAFAEVLTTWSSNPACTINLTFFNRIPFHEQVDQIIGDFTSLTLLQVGTPALSSTADEPFEARARRTQQQLWNDLDHSYVSGVRVMRHLHRTRRDLPNALMPVVFTSMLAPDMHHRATTATQTRATAATAPHRMVDDAELVYSITQTPQVWLDHQVSEGDDESLLFNWDVVEDLFPAGLIDDMFHAYTRFLKRLARDESAWQLPPQRLAPSEQLEQHAALNATTQPFPLVRTSTATGQQREVQLHPLLHTMFEWQAKRHPHNNAIISSHLTLTYGELHRFASQLGRRLQALGATPNTLVAVVMEKGWEQIAAVLGILYAGAAYLPIEATLPQERRCSLLDNGAVSLVLTQPWLEQTLSWPAGVQVLALEYDDGLIDDEAADGFYTAAQRPTDLAYVLYTSGSTGTPKGVMIDHRAAVNTISDINRRFAVQPDDNVLALSSLSFDLSVYDIFGTLAAGATLVLPDAEHSRNPAHWAELVQQEHITIWNSVPALMKLLVEYATQHPHINLSALRLVLLSGDWIPLTLPEQLRALNQRVEVISLGGATEAAIWSILYPIRRVELSWRSIPYGFPMANQSLLVLNDHMAHCPVWVPGHLYIGGVGLAQGYWRDEARTAERFLRHPQSGERLYRTGDMGCYLPDGTIELLGREDLQVKIQGYRVEPGEIEAILERHPSVQAVAVVAVGPREERRLVACIVPTTMPGQPSALISELRQVVQEQVPAYMVPASFVVLDALPLTPNGKVDRQALAQMPAAGTADVPAPVTTPAAPGLLEPLQRLVAEVLHLAHVPPDADLLELGATSVDIIRIINHVEQQYGTRPPIGEFYLTPTIATLGRMVAPAPAPEREPVAETPPAPATPPEALTPPQPPRLLRDPAERLAFKQQMPGVRRVSEAQPRIALSATPQHLYERAAARRSHRTFAQKVLPFAHLSRLLGALRQFTYNEQPGYLYPSAGGLYPVQTYLHIKPGRVEGFDGGIYYYHPLEHTLVTLAAGAMLERTIHDPLVNAAIFDAAAFSIFLIARLGTMQALYGSYALEFCLLEAGAMSQALMMTAPEQHIGLCPIGDLNFAAIRHLFALEENHQLLHSLLGGVVVEPGDATEAPRATDDVAYHFADQAAETEYEEGEV
jgi:amino acid adenylation domain-containing protein